MLVNEGSGEQGRELKVEKRWEGWVCVYVKSELPVNIRDDITNGTKEEVECLWLELQGEKQMGN